MLHQQQLKQQEDGEYEAYDHDMEDGNEHDDQQPQFNQEGDDIELTEEQLVELLKNAD